MKRYILFLTVIISLSIGCTDFEPVSPVRMETDYFLESVYESINCTQSFNEGMSIYDYSDSDIAIDLVTYSEYPVKEFSVMCANDFTPIEFGEAFIVIRYGGKAYHSFKGRVTIIESIVINATFYEAGDRTYKEYNFNIELICEDI